MKPKNGDIRSISNTHNIFFSSKFSRRSYEERAKTATSKERPVPQHSPYGFEQIQRLSGQLNMANLDVTTGTFINTPFKIDKAFLNFNPSYRNNQNAQIDNEPIAPASTNLNELLQIKSVNPLNQRKPIQMNQLPSKFSINGLISPSNNQMQQRTGIDPLVYPSYVRNKEILDDTDDHSSVDGRNEKLPNFKTSNSALYLSKQPITRNDMNKIDNIPDRGNRTVRMEEIIENGVKLSDFKSNPESPTHQVQNENTRYLEYDRGLLRRPLIQQSQEEKTQQPEFESISRVPTDQGQEKVYTNYQKLKTGANTQNKYVVKSSKPIVIVGLSTNVKNPEPNSEILGNISSPNGTISLVQNQLPSQSKKSQAALLNQINTSPPPNDVLIDPNINPLAENNAVLLPMRKETNMNNLKRTTNRSGYSVTNRVTSLKSSTTYPTNIDQTTNSIPMNSNSQSTVINKLVRPEHLRPEEKEKRRLTYQPLINTNTTYKYYIGGGNNAELVERVISKRENWEQTESLNQHFNLKWQQYNRGYRYERLITNPNFKQLVNHFEFHKEITTKNGLIKSLSSYCEFNRISVFDFIPITFSFDMDDSNFDIDMHRFTKFFIKHCGDPKKYTSNEQCSIKRSNPNILFTYEFKRKGKTLHIMQKSVNQKKVSPYLKPKLKKAYYNGGNIWLLKPTGLNRGRGIELFNTLEDLNRYTNQYLEGEKSSKKKATKGEDDSELESSSEEEESKLKKGPPGTRVRSNTFVIQKYIERPLLVNQRKFDIRVYAMVTHEMQLMFFKEGYLRTSSEIYSIGENDIDNKFVHLTNDAVQKYSDKYGQAEQGNKLNYDEFQKYLDTHKIPLDMRGKVVPRMKELVQLSMNSVKRVLNQNDRKYCFEIFGYDFFIDEDLNIWLIEVNTNPCLEESCPLLGAIIPRMLDDAFKLTVDVLFPPKKQPIQPTVARTTDKRDKEDSSEASEIYEKEEKINHSDFNKADKVNKSKSFPLFDYNDDANLWEHLCSLEYIRPSIKKPTNGGGLQRPVMRI